MANIYSGAQKEIRRYFSNDGWIPPTPHTLSSGADYRAPVDPSLIRNAPMATAVWSAGWFGCVPPLLLLRWLLFLCRETGNSKEDRRCNKNRSFFRSDTTQFFDEVLRLKYDELIKKAVFIIIIIIRDTPEKRTKHDCFHFLSF